MRWKKLRSPIVTLFCQDNGPMCYQVAAWDSLAKLASFVDTILASELDWYWKSEYAKIGVEPPPAARVQQSLCQLNASTRERLLQNAWYMDDEDHKLELHLFAFAGPFDLQMLDGHLPDAAQRFVSGVPGPLQAVIYWGCDERDLYIYVPMATAGAMSGILAEFGASPGTARRLRLRGWPLLQLESQFGIESAALPKPPGVE